MKGGFKAATTDETQIRAWWTRWPDANVGIATGASGLCVLDVDTGLTDAASVHAFEAYMRPTRAARTYTVRTGRRPGFGVQIYFQGDGLKSIAWQDGDFGGDIRCATGYVMAEGSIHPSGEAYERLAGDPAALAGVPEYVRNVPPAIRTGLGLPNAPIQDDGGKISDHRNNHMVHLLGKQRAAGLGDDAIEEYAHTINEARFDPPLDEPELRRIVQNICKYPVPDNGPAVVIGGKVAGTVESPAPPPSEPVDWRTRYMTSDAFNNVKPPVFLIDGFLVQKSMMMLAGPVAQRKRIIALNIAHALCTGEPLFGYFDVTLKPERVVYLCPEMGAASFVKRIKAAGLSEHVGKRLFIQTMTENPSTLDDLEGELPGSVVLLDTITRFVAGDENSSADMRLFAAKVFRLMSAGATVILLHHSKKGSSGTLDDGLRGSSELAAFVDSCWVTELEDPKKPYESLSKMRNVKQRDFECDPFKLLPTPGSYFLSMSGEPEPEAVLKTKAEAAATEALKVLLAENPKLGIGKLKVALKARGHGKGQKWIMAARAELLGAGVTLAEQPGMAS